MTLLLTATLLSVGWSKSTLPAAGDEDGAGGDEEGPEELGLDTDGEAVKLARGELIFRHEEDVLGSPVAEPAGEPGEVDAKEEEAAGDEVDDPPSSSVVVVRLGPEGEADGDEGEGRPDPGEPGPLVREVGADALELEELRVELPTRVVVLEQRLRRVALRVRLAHHFDPENRALRDVLRQGHDAPIVCMQGKERKSRSQSVSQSVAGADDLPSMARIIASAATSTAALQVTSIDSLLDPGNQLTVVRGPPSRRTEIERKQLVISSSNPRTAREREYRLLDCRAGAITP